MDFTAIVVAVLGSSVITVVATSLTERFSRDRDRRQYELLHQESELLDKIWVRTQEESNPELKASRTLLKAVVGAGHNQKNIRFLIDKGRFSTALLYTFAATLIILGMFAVVSSSEATNDASGSDAEVSSQQGDRKVDEKIDESSGADALGHTNDRELQDSAVNDSDRQALQIGWVLLIGGFLLIIVNLAESTCKAQLRANLLAAIGGDFPDPKPRSIGNMTVRSDDENNSGSRKSVQERNSWSGSLSVWTKVWVTSDIRMNYGALMTQLVKAHEQEATRKPPTDHLNVGAGNDG